MSRKRHRKNRQRTSLVNNQRDIRASIDVAQTTDDNTRHWTNADYLSPDAVCSYSIRRLVRARSRYEILNNSYYRGMIETLASDIIGTGPRLQLIDGDKESNAQIEYDFSQWAENVNLGEKLRVILRAKKVDGESFCLLVTDGDLEGPVRLNLRPIEADLITTPDLDGIDSNKIDGMVLNSIGNPIEYHMLKYHPGGEYVSVYDWNDYDRISPEQMIHWYRQDRPGQHRGLPETLSALPLFAQIRRFTLAVIAAAETIADFALTIESIAGATYATQSSVKAMEEVDLSRRMATVLPEGYKLGQVRPEQPPSTYKDFKSEILAEIGRCLNMPYAIAAGDSSRHNYASGRLDYQVYDRSNEVEQKHCEVAVVNKVFKSWLIEYLSEKSGISPSSVDTSLYRKKWLWRQRGHVDPFREAKALEIKLDACATTLAEEYAKEGKDWEVEVKQRMKELEVLDIEKINALSKRTLSKT